MIGKSISHYKITEKLGEGGMGLVYRAHDENLDRDVAIKILPEEVAQNPEHLVRFEREAKAIAALKHPNIVTIYSVEEVNGVHFITMELVEGQTLSEILPAEGFPRNRHSSYQSDELCTHPRHHPPRSQAYQYYGGR